MATFLEGVRTLREKCGIAGNGPTSVVAQSGEALRLVNWFQEAWNEIQALHTDWKWMRGSFSFQTAPGKLAYLPTADAGEVGITDLARWHGDSFRMWLTGAGRHDEQFLPEWSHETWRNTYDFGSQAELQQRPSMWAERPGDQAILLGPLPDNVYTVVGEYQRAPSELVGDAAVPGMPKQFHRLIVYKAMMLYGAYEAAPEVRAEGEDSYDRMLSLLEDNQRPPLTFGEPLA